MGAMRMDDKEFLEKESREDKEFVYEQLRKILCIFVVGEDITNNNCPTLKDQTSEQIRTVFNNGYKLAMHQTVDSLKKLKKVQGSESNALDLAISQIKDRLITCDCFTSYENSYDETMLKQSIKRSNDFQYEVERQDLCTWGIKHM
jgi:hypothetical protein